MARSSLEQEWHSDYHVPVRVLYPRNLGRPSATSIYNTAEVNENKKETRETDNGIKQVKAFLKWHLSGK